MPNDAKGTSKGKTTAPSKPKAKETPANKSSTIARPKLKVPSGPLPANSFVTERPQLALKEPKQTPQQPLKNLVKKATANTTAAAKEIKEIKDSAEQARTKEKAEVKEIAELYNKETGFVSQAEVEKIHNTVMDQAAHVEEFENSCLGQIEGLNKQIADLTDAFSNIMDEHDKLMYAMRMLSRSFELKPEPLKDERQGKCFFCYSTKHAAKACYQFASAPRRRAELTKEGRCWICFKIHEEVECPEKKAKRCGCMEDIKHHPLVCLTKASAEAVAKIHAAAAGQEEEEDDELGDA